MSQSTTARLCRSRLRSPIVALLFFLASSQAWTTTHRIYEFNRSRGLPTNSVHGVIQDSNGFIWVGGTASLIRYDGREFRRWNKTRLEGSPEEFANDKIEGLLMKLSHPSLELRRVTATGIEPFEPKLDPPLKRVRDVAADELGNLWIADAEGVRHRTADGLWQTLPLDRFAGELPHQIRARPNGGITVAANRGLYLISPLGELAAVATAPGIIVSAQESDSGEIFVAHGGVGGSLTRVEDGELIPLASAVGRTTDMIIRGDAVWVAFDFSLLRWHPEEGSQLIRADGGVYTGGGRLFIDHERSLWIGSYSNLIQLPEPATSIWTPEDGLASITATSLALGEEGLWASAYQGISLIRERDGQRSGETVSAGFSPYRVCVDADGRAWHARKDRYFHPTQLFESGGGERRIHLLGGAAREGSCSLARDGHVWFARGQTIYATPRGGGEPLAVGSLPEGAVPRAIFEATDRSLWLGVDGQVCHSATTDPQLPTDWSCEQDERFYSHHGFVEPLPGEIWVSTKAGALRRSPSGWEFLKGIERGDVNRFVPSPRGGVWVVAGEYVVRVIPDADEPGRVEIVERLTHWLGLPEEGGTSIVETDDGELWLSTRRGVVNLPAEVRDQALPIPAVELVGLTVEGESQSQVGGELRLKHDRNDVELFFAAISYRDRALVRYRVRSHPSAPWRETQTPSFSFVDLAPGSYRPEVAASLDGVNWTAEPATLTIRVAAPWYSTLVARLAFGILVASLLYLLYRLRLAVQLQAERQRTRIAMDLHDEMGSGLGSIRILSDVLEQPELSGSARGEVVGQIQKTAEELNVALADIVWSLRPRARRLQAVLARVETLARRLLPPPNIRVTLSAEAVDARMILSQPVCKNLLAISAESFHNIARHADASMVTIEMIATGRQLQLLIADDGRGFDARTLRADGLGLTSMARRAADIGAQLDIDSRPGEGTTITLRFDPLAKDRRLLPAPTEKGGGNE